MIFLCPAPAAGGHLLWTFDQVFMENLRRTLREKSVGNLWKTSGSLLIFCLTKNLRCLPSDALLAARIGTPIKNNTDGRLLC